ncbi:hypothetical protein D3C80_1924220 [compost metagenome]
MLDVIGAAASRRQHGDATGDIGQRRDVFVSHDLIGMPFALLGAHRHQYNGFAGFVGRVCSIAV